MKKISAIDVAIAAVFTLFMYFLGGYAVLFMLGFIYKFISGGTVSGLAAAIFFYLSVFAPAVIFLAKKYSKK